jgi:hypothetical protein
VFRTLIPLPLLQQEPLPLRHKIGRVKAVVLVGGTSQGEAEGELLMCKF